MGGWVSGWVGGWVADWLAGWLDGWGVRGDAYVGNNSPWLGGKKRFPSAFERLNTKARIRHGFQSPILDYGKPTFKWWKILETFFELKKIEIHVRILRCRVGK